MHTSPGNLSLFKSTIHSGMLTLSRYCIYMHEGGAPPYAYSRTKQAHMVQCDVPAYAPTYASPYCTTQSCQLTNMSRIIKKQAGRVGSQENGEFVSTSAGLVLNEPKLTQDKIVIYLLITNSIVTFLDRG